MPAASTITLSTRSAVVGTLAAVAVVAAYAVGSHGTARAVAAEPTPSPTQTGITVTGLGKVTGVPDVLLLGMGVDVQRSSVDDALHDANVKLAKVTAQLKAHGVAKADLQTSGLSINPVYDYVSGHEVLRGYEVSESLSAKVRDLKTAGKTIGAAALAGGDAVRINDISLDLEGDSALLKQARDAAFADAKAKAQQYAGDAGRGLGSLQSISEKVSEPPQPTYFADRLSFASAAGAPGSAVPISKGTQDVTVTITTVWSMS